METIKEVISVLNVKINLYCCSSISIDIQIIRITLINLKGYSKYKIEIVYTDKTKCFILNSDFTTYKLKYRNKFKKFEKIIIDFIEKCMLIGRIWIS